MNAKIKPAVFAAERHIVGAILRGADLLDEVRAALRADDFANLPFRLVFDAACQLRDANERVDPLAVTIHLQKTGAAADLGSHPSAFITEIYEAARSTENLKYTVATVQEASTMRALSRIGQELDRDAADFSEPATDLAARAERQIFDVAANRQQREPVNAAEAVREAVERYDATWRGERKMGIPTGFARLDQKVGGLALGQLTIIGARPSVGKSAIAIQVMLEASRLGNPALFFSLEMARGEVVDRAMAIRARVPLPRLRGLSPIEQDDAARIAEQTNTNQMAGFPFAIEDMSDIGADGIAAVARRDIRKRGTKLIVVDYLQLIKHRKPEGMRDASANYLIGYASKRLKRLAKEANVAVLCLAQLNREKDKRNDSSPRLSDLRDSGEIEQDADVVLLLDRVEEDEKNPVHKVNVIIAKNRHGPRGTVEMEYERRFTRFYEVMPT